MIELTTLGGVSIERDGAVLSGLSAHRQKCALLIYLALEGPVARDRLLTIFWPERDEERARHSLSQAIYALRGELHEECIRVEGNSVGVAPDRVRVDARALETAVEAGDWFRAVDLYSGPFLQGFTLGGATGFEDWSSATRLRLARLARRAYSQAVAERETAGERGAALGLAARWAELEPLEDEAQHTLIALLARSGKRSAALEQYEKYRQRLARELDVEPLQETVELVERIRSGESPEFRPLGGPAVRDARAPAQRVDPAEAEGEPADAPATVEEPPPVTYAAARPSDSGAGGDSGRYWKSLIAELRSRRIFQVGLVYLGAAWLALQLSDMLIEQGVLPGWVFEVLLFFLAIGLPFTLIFAWAHEGPANGAGRSWLARLRPGYVLLVLGTLIAALVVGREVIPRGEASAESDIEASAGHPLTRIAVLYLDDHSKSGSLDYLAAGLTEELIDDLSQVPALDVLPRNAVKPFREGRIPLDSVIELLRVGSLVEGSVSGSPERVRVKVQLIDAATQTHLDSRTVEGSAADPLALLDNLAEQVSQLLRNRLGVEIRERRRRAGTESPEAWKNVQRADEERELAFELRNTNLDPAEDALNRADSLLAVAETHDPDWITPTLGRAQVAVDRAQYLHPPGLDYDPGWARTGIAHVNRALELAPENARAFELRGILMSYLAKSVGPENAAGLRDAAVADLRRAVALDPSLAMAWSRLASLLRDMGRFKEANYAAERALEADAFLDNARVVMFRLCETALDLQDFESARRWCFEGRRRFPDRPGFVAAELALLAGDGGAAPDVDRAWESLARLEELAPPDLHIRAEGLLQVAAVIARAGLTDSARGVIADAQAADTLGDPDVLYQEAHARLQLGEYDRALELLRRYLQEEPEERNAIRNDWWFRSLRSDPRFQELVDR